jgi:hypothetical protein
MECDRPRTPSSGGYRNGDDHFQGGRTLAYALCDSADHLMAKCPLLAVQKGLVKSAASPATTTAVQQ